METILGSIKWPMLLPDKGSLLFNFKYVVVFFTYTRCLVWFELVNFCMFSCGCVCCMKYICFFVEIEVEFGQSRIRSIERICVQSDI